VTASSTLSVNSSPSPSPPLPPQPWAEEFKHFNTGDEEYISSKDSDPMIDAYVTFDEPVFTEIYSSSSQPFVWSQCDDVKLDPAVVKYARKQLLFKPRAGLFASAEQLQIPRYYSLFEV